MSRFGTTYKQYTDSDKAAALVMLGLNKGNVAKTARILRMPRKTIDEWAAGRNQNGEVAKLRHFYGVPLANRLEEAAFNLLEGITPEKIKRATLLQIARALGLIVDAMLALQGKPNAFKLCPKCYTTHKGRKST